VTTDLFAGIWELLVANELRETNYLAEMAKVFAEISYENGYLQFKISGFSESLRSYCLAFFTKLRNFDSTTNELLY
jgi:secreted Zn-dependent insulinase-like peptidase